MKLVPYQPLHYIELASRVGATQVLALSTVELVANFHFLRGIGYTAVQDGQVVGTAGIVEMWPGVAEVWSLLTPEVKASPFFLHRRAARMMATLVRMKRYHRLHASVNLSDEVAIKWITRLGFRQEAVMEKFSANKEDYGLFVKFPGVTEWSLEPLY